MGATPRSAERTRQALMKLVPYKHLIVFHTWPGPMGADLLRELGFYFQVHGFLGDDLTTADDTVHAAKMFAESGVDLILFAGGDGTARNICDSIPESQPVLGIPAGVKIHSGVYAVTPSAAGEILALLVTGELVDIRPREVRDIDEQAFRQGRVRAQHYGELLVPESGRFLQNVKQGGREVEELVLNDIADDLREQLDDDYSSCCWPRFNDQGHYGVSWAQQHVAGG